MFFFQAFHTTYQSHGSFTKFPCCTTIVLSVVKRSLQRRISHINLYNGSAQYINHIGILKLFFYAISVSSIFFLIVLYSTTIRYLHLCQSYSWVGFLWMERDLIFNNFNPSLGEKSYLNVTAYTHTAKRKR